MLLNNTIFLQKVQYICYINLELSCLSFLPPNISVLQTQAQKHKHIITPNQSLHWTYSISINPFPHTRISPQRQHLATQAPNIHTISPVPHNTRQSASAMAVSKTRAAHFCTSITCHQANTDNCRRSRTQARLSDPNYLRVPDSVWNHIHYNNQIDKDYMEAAENTLTSALAADTTTSPMIGLIKV